MSRSKGAEAEKKALEYLISNGLSLLEKNYRSHFGEIDLIVKDKSELVFVEVRQRASQDFGGAIESVNKTKQKKLIKTAEQYLVSHQKYDKMACRFDVVCFDTLDNIDWIKNAFSA